MQIHNKYTTAGVLNLLTRSAVRTYASAIAVIATAAMLIFTIYFTRPDVEWITFLAGVVVAAILAMVGRTSYAESLVARCSAQLTIVQDSLASETQQRKELDEAHATAKARLHFSDEALPVMVAYVDADGRCRYHNHAFRKWLGLPPEKIDGRHMRDVLGRKVYSEMEATVDQLRAGQPAHYERTQKMPDGAIYRLLVQHVSQFGSDGKFAGFYLILTDITVPGDVRSRAADSAPVAKQAQAERGIIGADARTDAASEQGMFVNSLAEQVTGWKDAASRIIASIEKDEFILFFQLVRPLTANPGQPDHYEIFIRLLEEEENLMAPGAFFPLAEENGLMPHLDRWVVTHVLEWLSSRKAGDTGGEDAIFFVKLAEATIRDPNFPDFVENQLQKFGVPGSAVCFEITESELTSQRSDTLEFVRLIKQAGCHSALSGFGRDRVSVDILKQLPVNFLKIDGGIIFNILRDPVALAKVIAINRIAKAIGIRTIAELVESDETITKLREINIDFAQGFGVSRLRPLAELG